MRSRFVASLQLLLKSSLGFNAINRRFAVLSAIGPAVSATRQSTYRGARSPELILKISGRFSKNGFQRHNSSRGETGGGYGASRLVGWRAWHLASVRARSSQTLNIYARSFRQPLAGRTCTCAGSHQFVRFAPMRSVEPKYGKSHSGLRVRAKNWATRPEEDCSLDQLLALGSGTFYENVTADFVGSSWFPQDSPATRRSWTPWPMRRILTTPDSPEHCGRSYSVNPICRIPRIRAASAASILTKQVQLPADDIAER